jgi:opacity protein-like surface antigen
MIVAAPGAARAQSAPLVDWRGYYIGYQTGSALGFVDVDDPFGGSIFGDTVRTPGPFVGGQAGYNWQSGSTIYGLEADAVWADLSGTNTCFAFSGFYISSNCETHVGALGTLTGRLGWLLPFDPQTLLYAKGGLAWEYSRIKATPNGGAGVPTSQESAFQLGYTLGAGAERMLARGWSLRAEYDFLGFGGPDAAASPSFFQTAPPLAPPVPFPGAGAGTSQAIHEFKIGMNYQLGERGVLPGPDFIGELLPHRPSGGTEIEAGARYVYGWSQFHKDLGLIGQGVTSLASRLTYDNTSTSGGELFARIDTPHNIMLKGLIGAGTSSGGDLNDEDWGLQFPNGNFIPYSNTLSDVDNRISYAIADVGYDWWRGSGYKIAPFIGFSWFEQHLKGYGCAQISNPNSDCGNPIATGVLVITEYDTWNALRLGTVVDLAIAPQLKLTVDAAYLPYVSFNGTDNHVLRTLVSPEDGSGTGAQIEAMLSYAVTDAFSLGIGGRYWSLWTNSAEVDFGGTGLIVPMRYNVEQAQLLLQGSYRFDALLPR